MFFVCLPAAALGPSVVVSLPTARLFSTQTTAAICIYTARNASRGLTDPRDSAAGTALALFGADAAGLARELVENYFKCYFRPRFIARAKLNSPAFALGMLATATRTLILAQRCSVPSRCLCLLGVCTEAIDQNLGDALRRLVFFPFFDPDWNETFSAREVALVCCAKKIIASRNRLKKSTKQKVLLIQCVRKQIVCTDLFLCP